MWTPETLAAAIRATLGVCISGRTIRRACERGEFEGARRPGPRGKWRIPARAVRARWPALYTAPVFAEAA